MIGRLHYYAREAGRDPSNIGLEKVVALGHHSEDEWAADVRGWRDAGATHISVNTMRSGIASADGHIEAIRRFRESVGDV